MSAGVDAVETRRLAWMAANQKPDESEASATSRFRRHELHGARAAVRISAKKPPEPFIPLSDDGVDDRIWARAHPDRQYRVRPWRPIDGEPVTYRFPCVTAFDVRWKDGVYGIPCDALHNAGFPVQATDSDDYAELLLLVRKASRGFRAKRPGASG